MAKFTAMVEQAADGSWSAYTLSPTVVAGIGVTRDDALVDLKLGMVLWLEYMKETNQIVAEVSAELVSFEVA